MTKKKKPKNPFPALKSYRNKSEWAVDYDYVSKLNDEEKRFLNQFTDEFYEGNGRKYKEPLLDIKEMDAKNDAARRDVMNQGAGTVVNCPEMADTVNPNRVRYTGEPKKKRETPLEENTLASEEDE